MPLYAPCPEPDSRISKLTKIRADHVIIAGACIGIDADILAHANKKVIDVQKRVNAIARLAPVNEQAAFKLLGEVATTTPLTTCFKLRPRPSSSRPSELSTT